MEVFVGDRRSGKTTAAVQWVLQGGRRDYWPYWSRVIVVPNKQMHDHFRSKYFKEIEDFSHRVFYFDEWDTRASHVRSNDVKVLYEEAQFYLPGDADAVTISAKHLTGLIANHIIP